MANEAKIPVATLIERESANGNGYFSGPFGNAKTVMFRDRRDAPDGSPVWTLYMQDNGREPRRPAGPPDSGPMKQAAEGVRSAVRESAASDEPWQANARQARQRPGYGGGAARSSRTLVVSRQMV